MFKPDKHEIKYIAVMVCNLRKVLKAHGVSVKNEFGKGYYIAEADKARLRAALTCGAQEAAA